MRAIVIREPGGPEVLSIEERPDPKTPRDHVRVKVHHAGVNRADLLQRMGMYPAPPGVAKDIPGLEYAGVVDEIGDGVTRFREGDRVYGLVGGGAYASMLVAHEREVVKVPEKVGDESAAAVPEAFVTAYDALVVRGRAQAGDRVLIHAAGSGVGTAAIQIARALGCFVIGTSRTKDKLERCVALGMDKGVIPAGNKFADEVLKATHDEGVDVVVDLVGGSYFEETLLAAASRARIVSVGLTAGASSEINLGLLIKKRAEIIGTALRSRPLEEKIEAAQMLERPIGAWLSRGLIGPVLDRTFAAAEVARAHEYVAGNASFGKVLLRF